MKRWLAIQTHTYREYRAVFHVKHQKFEVYLPHSQGKDWRPYSLFSRYLLLNVDSDCEPLRSVQFAVGVAKSITFCERLNPIPKGAVERKQAQEAKHWFIGCGAKGKLRNGDPVQLAPAFFRSFGEFLIALKTNNARWYFWICSEERLKCASF